jgi:hypothetical protein
MEPGSVEAAIIAQINYYPDHSSWFGDYKKKNHRVYQNPCRFINLQHTYQKTYHYG